MAQLFARITRGKRNLVVGLALALSALGIAGIDGAEKANAATHLYVDLRVEPLAASGGVQRVRVCNYGSYTSKAFRIDFYVGGSYGTGTDQLASGYCSTWRLGALSCGTGVTVIADANYRTTGYNYGANRWDGYVSC